MKHQIWGTHGPVSRQTKPCQEYSKVRSGTGLCNRGRLLHSTFAGDLSALIASERFVDILRSWWILRLYPFYPGMSVKMSQSRNAIKLQLGVRLVENASGRGTGLRRTRKVELETFHGHDRAKNGVPVPCSLNSPWCIKKSHKTDWTCFMRPQKHLAANYLHTAQDAWCEDMRSLEAPRQIELLHVPLGLYIPGWFQICTSQKQKYILPKPRWNNTETL